MNWIPCSEKQPENTGTYLTTILESDGAAYVEDTWYSMISGWGEYGTGHVLAWMPWPPPYQLKVGED